MDKMRIFSPEFIALIEKSRGVGPEATDAEIKIHSISENHIRMMFSESSSLTDREKTLIGGNIRGFWSQLISAAIKKYPVCGEGP